MPIKSVLDVDVNDSAFRAFVNQYAKYQEALKKTPELWKKVKEEIEEANKVAPGAGTPGGGAGGGGGGGRSVPAIPGSRPDVVRRTREASHEQRKATLDAREQARAWRNLAHYSKDFSHNVTDATRSIMRWTGIATLVGGLLGGGSLFGIDRLAGSASALRRSSLGLGVSAGEEQAFNLNYGRVVDTNQLLSGVNEALHDVTKRPALTAAGLTGNDINGKDTAQVATSLISHLKTIADQTDPSVLANVFHARHFDQFMSFNDFQRLRATPRGELGEYNQNYQNDKQSLSLTQQQMKAWQDLQVQMSRAGTTIENTFIVGLTDLAKPLGELSKSFTDLVQALLKSPQVKEWIDDLASGIERFAKYIDTPEFTKGVQDFVKDVADLASAVGSAFKEIMGWVDWFRGKSVKDITQGGGVNGNDPANMPGSPEWRRTHPRSTKDDLFEFGTERPDPDADPNAQGAVSQYWHRFQDWWDGKGAKGAAYHQLEGAAGLPQGLLENIEYRESGGRDLTSRAGAKGYFQFMDATADRYGVDVHDEASSAVGAAKYFRDLLKMFHGNLEASIASYNWGENNVRKDMEAHGARWKDFLPDETQKYVANVMGGLRAGNQATMGQPGGRGVTITVNNNTGGNATVTTSQLAV